MSKEKCQGWEVSGAIDDYYSPEKDREYMSCSQFSAFADQCELAAYKRYVTNEIEKEEKDCFLEGNFGHTAFESPEAHEKFIIKNHDNIIAKTGRTKGELKAPYKLLQEIIEIAKSTPAFMKVLQGEPEVEYTGEIAGVPWKIRVDNIDVDTGMFTDIKFVKSIVAQEWITLYYNTFGNFSLIPHPDFPMERNKKVPFYEAHGYWRRSAVYQEILKQSTGKTLLPILAAISKEVPPDMKIISMHNPKRITAELENIKLKLPRIMKLKNKEIEPVGCGICEVCREHRIANNQVPHIKADSYFYNKGEN
jgi:hypothetical protein